MAISERKQTLLTMALILRKKVLQTDLQVIN